MNNIDGIVYLFINQVLQYTTVQYWWYCKLFIINQVLAMYNIAMY